MLKKGVLFLSAIALVCTFMASPGTATGQAEDVAKSFIAKYQKLFNAGDLEALASLYLPDAVLMPVYAPAQVGSKQIRAFMEGVLNQWSHSLKFDPVDVAVFDGWAFVRIEITGEAKEKDSGRSQSINNKGLVILRQSDDGTWKFYRYMFNANVPSSTS